MRGCLEQVNDKDDARVPGGRRWGVGDQGELRDHVADFVASFLYKHGPPINSRIVISCFHCRRVCVYAQVSAARPDARAQWKRALSSRNLPLREYGTRRNLATFCGQLEFRGRLPTYPMRNPISFNAHLLLKLMGFYNYVNRLPVELFTFLCQLNICIVARGIAGSRYEQIWTELGQRRSRPTLSSSVCLIEHSQYWFKTFGVSLAARLPKQNVNVNNHDYVTSCKKKRYRK